MLCTLRLSLGMYCTAWTACRPVLVLSHLVSMAVLVQEAFWVAGWLSCGRQRLLLCSLQNSHGDIAWCVSEVHLHMQLRVPLILLLSLQKLKHNGPIIIQIE